MDKTSATYEIPTANWSKFEHKIARINRKAAKLGVEPVTVSVIRDFLKTIEINQTLDVKVAYREIMVEGMAPKINGWTFVATLQHLGEDGNLIRTIPGASLPETFRTNAPICQHCNKARRRIDTYVLRSDAGEFKQVGSNCLGDFLGALDPHSAAAWCGYLASARPDSDEFEMDSGGRAHYLYDLETYLAYVAMTIEKDGWLSRTAARDRIGMAATADLAYDRMCPDPKSNKARQRPTDTHKKQALEALEWVRATLPAKQDLSDYEYNMMVVTRHDDIDERMMGLAASLIQMHARAMEREIEQRQRAASEANSQFVGTEKKRETFELTVTRITPLEGNYGTTYMHRFLDAAGNVVVWFASGCLFVPQADGTFSKLEVGQTYKIKGTTKKHEQYKGINQTLLTRCKIESKVTEEAK